MAKTKLRNRWVKSPVGTANMRRFNVLVEVGRNSTLITPRGRAVRGDPFMACVRVPSKKNPRNEVVATSRRVCAWANNPRKAVASAFVKLARVLPKRRGAFRGRGR